MQTLRSESNGRILDRTSWLILNELQRDARLSYAELGRRVGLSAPAVMERVRKLEDAGVITGYHARIDPQKLGVPLLANIRLSQVRDITGLKKFVRTRPEALECIEVTGEDCFVIKAALCSTRHLEAFRSDLGRFGSTTTSLILGDLVDDQTLDLYAICNYTGD